MYVPSAKEVVEIAGSPDLFRVLWVNQPAKRVDLLALKARPYAIADVPFALLRPYQEPAELETEPASRMRNAKTHRQSYQEPAELETEPAGAGIGQNAA